MYLKWKSNKRLQRIEAQLPDAMDLISRALRAGHSFPSALSMVGTEAQEPIASEFKTTFDEISFGISNDQALNNLAARVPSADMRYFVMAVIIQRETGGNLSELLGKLSDPDQRAIQAVWQDPGAGRRRQVVRVDPGGCCHLAWRV